MERSLFIVKPDAVRRNHVGKVISAVEDGGLDIIAMRMITLSAEEASDFYHVHRGKPFYKRLIEYMSSGRCVVGVVEGDKAIGRLRDICGCTDPSDAAEGTIRATFGINITMNSIHASDAPGTAAEEVRFFFPDLD